MGRNLLTWALYDAGNSFLQTAIGGVYLAQWVVIDNGYPDIWYGATFTIATILVLVLSPLLGAWSDRLGKRMPFIKRLTILAYIANLGLVLAIISPIPATATVLIVLLSYLVVQALYQLSLVSYNSLIDVLSTPKTRGKVTGLGEASNNIGWIIGTAILLPFATGSIILIGTPGRSQVFLPAFLGFLILTLPMLFWFREKPVTTRRSSSAKEIYTRTLHGLKELFTKHKNLGTFLLGFSFVSDAVITLQLYFAVAMARIYAITDNQKFVLLVIMFVFNIISSYVLGLFSDKYGKKKVLLTSCGLLVGTFLVGFLGSNANNLYWIVALAGLAWGGFYVSSRALLVSLSPKERLGEYFGLYSTFQRFASIIGPLLWGMVTLFLVQYPIFKYRLAGLALIALIIVGTLILKGVREEEVLGSVA